MRNRGTILTTPKESSRGKKGSAFKTISFLESFPENERETVFSGHLRGDEGYPSQLPSRKEE
jgi:hypothetical protein